MKKKIPTYIIEEHHEAFIVWNDAICKNYIPSKNNYLFHIDEHSDMGIPRFNKSIHELTTIEEIIRFTYAELDIASFIIPACYKQIFNKVYWIRQKHNKLRIRPAKIYVRSYNQQGKRLISKHLKKKSNSVNDSDCPVFNYYLLTEDKIPANKRGVLDIDLDYFSCSGNPNQIREIEIGITQEEFNMFNANKYNRLHYLGFGNIRTNETKGNYYYIINDYNELYPCRSKVDEKTILSRIDSLTSVLKQQNIIPSIISICRSRFSGYTPEDQYEFIEHNLLKALQNTYSIKIEKIKNN